ncbi:hypothetical protein Rxyl_1552 [Rubrobacter xylanophilus DSM 9941]|uniref:Uncharacterized protein n=1 Tax=Rubrobacter xylanophilus (strain DSM 9941 / JCM 11954 / NBRC 16129 / PRD-1) TaxID=266117 RepID=Q1AVR4_RUBXD|nr:hypothetical protein Rxyl_1552 [Rubrobacter xylanophilus DSM 9941]
MEQSEVDGLVQPAVLSGSLFSSGEPASGDGMDVLPVAENLDHPCSPDIRLSPPAAFRNYEAFTATRCLMRPGRMGRRSNLEPG